jgi:RimJ/RimL family protein N-acetyltransferase
LRYASDELLLELTGAAAEVIVPGTLPFDGDATFYDPTPAGRRRWLSGQWSARARTSPSWWVLVFAVVVEGRAIGTQDITGADFPLLRTVDSFSWLTRPYQGQGLGREMRQAVLHLAFEGLGAEQARSEAFEDNAPSRGVSEALGYVRDGTVQARRRDQAGTLVRYVLTREQWAKRRRQDITISGLQPCLELLGLA